MSGEQTEVSQDETDGRVPARRSPFAREDWSLRAWLRLLRDVYCTFDRRTLGASRILLGFLLIMDLIHRSEAFRDFFSDEGVLPVWMSLERRVARGTFSIFNGFSTMGELHVLWALMAVVAVCLMLGYRTRLAQVLALVLYGSMNTRVVAIENGGYGTSNLLLLFTAFLPMGDRFSVDALLASLKRRREVTAAELNDRRELPGRALEAPFASAAGFVIVAQVAAIYYFNFVHKTGATWRDGSAVHYVLYVSRDATALTGLVRDHVPDPLVLFMTRTTRAFEAAIPVLLLSPLGRTWARRGVVFMICTLHVAFGTTLVLGPFAWSCCVLATLFVSGDDWELAAATMRRARRARVVLFDPRSGGALLVCRLLARLDHFALLTFGEDEGVPLGIGVQGQASRAGMLADLLEALPLGPTVAWVLRLRGVRRLCEAGLAAVEARDVSGFFGLRVEGARARPGPATALETPRIPAAAVVVPVLFVAAAIAVALHLGEPLPGVLLVLGATVIGAAGAAWFVYPVLTVAALRRAVVGSLRELLILGAFASAVGQALVELDCVRGRFEVPVPEALRVLPRKLRFHQSWGFFAPDPPTEDDTIVVDALTVDGRHVDPFTGRAPTAGIGPGSQGVTQIWSDYFKRIHTSEHAREREPLRDYLLRYPERTGRAEDALVSGDVYWVKARIPGWRQTKTTDYEKRHVFSFKADAAPEPRAP